MYCTMCGAEYDGRCDDCGFVSAVTPIPAASALPRGPRGRVWSTYWAVAFATARDVLYGEDDFILRYPHGRVSTRVWGSRTFRGPADPHRVRR